MLRETATRIGITFAIVSLIGAGFGWLFDSTDPWTLFAGAFAACLLLGLPIAIVQAIIGLIKHLRNPAGAHPPLASNPGTFASTGGKVGAVSGIVAGSIIGAMVAAVLLMFLGIVLVFSDQKTPLHDWAANTNNIVTFILICMGVGAALGSVLVSMLGALIGGVAGLFRRTS